MPEQTTATLEPLTREGAVELFRGIHDLHATQDVARIPSTFTEDVVYQDDGWHEAARGHDGVARFFSAVWRAFPDFRIELLEGPYLLEDGRAFAMLGVISGTMTGPLEPPGLAPTGTRMATEFAGFYEADGDRIRRGRVVMNTNAMAAQLGAIPERGSRAERPAVWFQHLQAWRMRRRAARSTPR